MPSARELLEQADALMRRNRSPLMDDIPVLTDAVPEARPGTPARLRPAPRESTTPDVPMLTESVPTTPAQPPAAAAPPTPPEAPEVVDEGEPSDWLQLDGAEPSIIGEAPDSIAMVPPLEEPVSEEIEVAAPPDVEESFDAELAEGAQEAEPSAQPAPEPPVPEPPPPASTVDVEPEPLSWTLEAEQSVEPAAMDAWSDTVVDKPPMEELPSVEIERPAEVAIPLVDTAEPGPSPGERQVSEDERWASMAEEIRMQVLQRIDLFTDTGLRDQLGARLQPIVDRASADLVATINQRVGELLRAYVAEAIEREIENWRRGS